MPPYSEFPCYPATLNCGGSNPAQFSQAKDLQVKISDRSPNSNAAPNTFGECGGSLQWCSPPAVAPSFFGQITHQIVSTTGTIQFDIPYDFPNAYCQNWANPDPAEWPTPNQNTTLRIFIGTSEILRSPAIFEHGRWQPAIAGIGCNGSQTYSIQLWTCSQSPPYVTIVSQNYTVTTTPDDCAPRDRQECSAGEGIGTSAGGPINVGSGNVSYRESLFTIAQEPMPLPFTLTYHSASPLFPGLVTSEPVGKGWTHQYNQILKPEAGSNGDRLYRITPEGYEEEYLRIPPATTWFAIRPGEARGTVSQPGSEYLLTDLNGRVTHFDPTTGRWNSTVDRWGNSISGSYNGSGQLETLTDSMGRQVVLTYSANQVTITLPNSKIWKLSLTAGLLTSIFDPLHTGATAWHTYTYVNDHAGILRLLASVKDDGDKELEAHTYDNADRGLTSSQAGGTRSNVTITYDDAGSTRTVKHTIDTSPTLLEQTAVFTLIYRKGRWLPTQISGNCATCGGADADATSLIIDASNHVINRKVGSGGDQVETRYTYDVNGMLLSKTEVGQRTTSYAYTYVPPAGMAPWPAFLTQVTEQSAGNPGGSKTTTYTWNSSGTAETSLTAVVTGYLNPSTSVPYTTTSTFGSPRHRLTAMTGPATNQKVTYSYITDSATNDGGRRQTTSVYTSATAHLDTNFAGYDLYGTPGTVTDPNNVQTVTTTDDRGRVFTVVSKKPTDDSNEPGDYTTSYLYDSRDRLTSVTSPLTNKTSYGYEDGTNRLTDTIRVDISGNQKERLHLTLNTIGGKKQEESQLCTAGNCTTWTTQRSDNFTYDSHNRLISVVHPDSAHIDYVYDTRGNLITVQDENHGTANTTYGYDTLNRLTSVKQTLAGAPAVSGLCAAAAGTIVTCYSYDVQDNLKSVTDPNGNITTYTYDDFRRTQSQVSPVSGTTTYSYDAAGNLTKSIDARQAAHPTTDGTTRTYDAANRITRSDALLTGQATETMTWTYDDPDLTQHKYRQGRLNSITDPSGSTTYAYERRGLLRNEAKTITPNTYILSYGYDANGNRNSITYPSGRVVTYVFDFADRPLSAASGATSYVSGAVYQPFGPESSLTYGTTPTMTRTMAFDQRYRPTELKLQGTSLIYDSFYREDTVGNIQSICASSGICSTSGNPYNRVFTYDDLNRLTTANSGSLLWGSGSYAYDSMGNMTSLTLGSRAATFTYVSSAGHQTPKILTASDHLPTTVSYDAAGNETAVGTSGYSYSSRGYLAGGDGLAYSYDGRGLRVMVRPQPSNVQTDYDADAKTDLAVFRPSNSTWYLQSSVNGTTLAVPFGASGDKPVVGDFNGDGKLDLGVFRPSTNYWYAETTAGVSVLSVQFGLSTDLLVPGDYDGDGATDLAVFRTGYWYIDTNRDGTPNISVQFGVSGDIPVPADYNGDGKMDLAVFRPSNGTWYIDTNRDGTADTTVQFGTSGDKPVQADYDGDGKADVAVFRPSTGYWYLKLSSDGTSPSVQWGASTDKLVAADYDADGKTDVAVFRPSDGHWYIIKSGNGASISPQWGTSGDIPTPGAALYGVGLQRINPLATVDTDASALADPNPTAPSGPSFHRASALSPKSVVPEPQRRYFLYSPEMNLLAESELTAAATPAISYEYIWFNGHPVAQIDLPSTTHWTFTDHLGTPLIQTTDLQVVYWRAEYEPYGKVFAYNPPGLADQHQPLRLPGQEAEQLNLGPNGVTERSYNIFRWYRPTWGRYTQADPIGMSQFSLHSQGPVANANLYAYVGNAPTDYIDPLGLQLVVPTQPPIIPLPPGCTAGPWGLLDTTILDLGSHNRWKQVESIVTTLIRQGSGTGGAAKGGPCDCGWVVVGREHAYQWASTFSRPVSCGQCPPKDYVEYGTGYGYRWLVNEGLLIAEPTARRYTRGHFIPEANACVCLPPD
jgi:RHS repeat-associated protein